MPSRILARTSGYRRGMSCNVNMQFVYGDNPLQDGAWVPRVTLCNEKPKILFGPLREAKHVTVKRSEDEPITDPGEGGPSPILAPRKRRKLHRLYVYDNIVHNGKQYLPQYATLSVVKTTSSGKGPFFVNSSAPSPLTEFPYWLPRLKMGGWNSVTPWWHPNDANMKLIYDMMKRNSDKLPNAYVPHTLVLHVKFVRYAGTEEQSAVRVKAAYIG